MKRFQAEDMKYLTYVSWPTGSEKGDLACVKYHGEESTGNFPSAIHLFKHGKEMQITEKGHSESQPVFTGNGDAILYLSDESGEQQIWQRDLCSGQKTQLTTLRHGVVRFAVSEKVKAIAFEAVMWPEEIENGTAFQKMTPDEKKQWLAELDMKPYIATDLVCKMDEWYGMRHGEYSHIGVLDLTSGEYTLVESGETELLYPAWSHDGAKLTCQGYPHKGAKGRMAEVFVWERKNGTLQQVTEDIGIYADQAPLFTADDQAVIAAGYPPFDDGSTIFLPYLIDISTGTYRYLLDENLAGPALHPVMACRTEFGPYPYYMTLDNSGKYLYFQGYRQGRGIVCRVSLDDPQGVETVLAPERDIHMFWLNSNGDMVYTAATPTQPPELFSGDVQLTHSNTWLKDYALGETKAYQVQSKDGQAMLPYYIICPPDFDPARKYPAILEIKGGPETATGLSFWHEFQAEAARGFVVITGNPRGSVGYGRAYNAGAICWRQAAMEDQLSFVEDAVKKGFIDEKRIGVTGGSYGGYMTMKLIGRTKVFAAAVAQRALANPVTSYGTGDMGFVSSGEVPADFSMKAYLEDRARDNVISYIDNMKVPLLILHAAKDYRCGFEQAEQIFIAMKDRNPEVPVRLVRFPDENHAMTRTGKLHHQLRHLKELVQWFEKYLKTEEDCHA